MLQGMADAGNITLTTGPHVFSYYADWGAAWHWCAAPGCSPGPGGCCKGGRLVGVPHHLTPSGRWGGPGCRIQTCQLSTILHPPRSPVLGVAGATLLLDGDRCCAPWCRCSFPGCSRCGSFSFAGCKLGPASRVSKTQDWAQDGGHQPLLRPDDQAGAAGERLPGARCSPWGWGRVRGCQGWSHPSGREWDLCRGCVPRLQGAGVDASSLLPCTAGRGRHLADAFAM